MNAKEAKEEIQRIIRRAFDAEKNDHLASEIIEAAEQTEVNGYKLDADFIQEMKDDHADEFRS